MSEVAGIGVDLCSVDRIEKAMERLGFRRMVYTPEEQEYLERQGKGVFRSAAAMFAAKEAAVKALGTGFSGGIMPDQIMVTHRDNGTPGIVVTGKARKQMEALGGTAFQVSISHEGGMAVAFVILLRREEKS